MLQRIFIQLLLSFLLILSVALPAHPLEKATIQLKWLHDFQYAGYYAALEKGFYRQAGLEVTLREGGPATDVEQEVLSGRAQFGIGTSALLFNRAKGQDLVVLAQIYQHSPARFAALRRSGIRSVADMAGRRFMFTSQHGDMLALMKAEGISEEQIQKVPHAGDPHDLLNGKADVMLVYSFNEPWLFEQQGEPYLLFSPLAAGIDFYGDNLFSSRSLTKQRPELVASFRKATLQGWRYALQHKEEVADLIISRYSQVRSREWLLFEANQLEPLIQHQMVELGHQNPDRWQHIADTFAGLGMLPKGFDATAIIYRAPAVQNHSLLISTMVVACLIIASLAGVVVVFRRLNRQLNRQQGYWKALFEHNGSGHLVVSPERKIVQVNHQFCIMFGYEEHELVGQPVRMLHIDEEHFRNWSPNFHQVAEGLTHLTAEYPSLRKDGSIIWCLFTGVRLVLPDGNSGVVWSLLDISDRKAIETELKRFSLVVEQTANIVVITDPGGVIEYVNPRFSTVTGYSPAEIIGKRLNVLKSGHHPPELYAQLWETIKSGRVWRGELLNRAKSGELFWELATITPLLDNNDTIINFVAIKELITEQKQTESALQTAREQAEAASRAKSEFLANMSHEIRTPMNGIISMAHLLRMTELTPEQQEYLLSMDLSAQNLLALISDILDISKIEAGKLELEHAGFSVRHAIGEVVLSQKPRISQKGLELAIDYDERLPQLVQGDSLRFKQVLLNLLGNAIKFTEAGRIGITLTVVAQDSSSLVVGLAVTDTGIGMPPEVLNRIFNPFEQADSSTTRRYGGSGLGLSICRRLVALMGGTIRAESLVGQGSSFFVELPFGRFEAVDEPDCIPADFSQGTPELRPLTILIAEDNQVNACSLKAILSRMGHRISVAENGQLAFEQCLAQQFNCILMDVQMPVLDGVEATRLIRERERVQGLHTPIIALTAHAMRGDRERLMADGFDGYIAKPVDIRLLCSEMQRVTAP